MLNRAIRLVRGLILILSIIPLIVLSGCGGGSGVDQGTASTGVPASLSDSSRELNLKGIVGDTPRINAEIIISDSKGEELLVTASDERGHYKITIPSGVSYPLILKAVGGTDIISNTEPGYAMLSIVEGSYQETANINSFSTLITESAKAMGGGLNLRNVSLAKLQITNSINFGLNNQQIPDIITSEIDKSNIASYVKAAAALGEWLRRTYRTLAAEEDGWSYEKLITTLSTDLVDGSLDGNQGEKAADIAIAATANVLSAQVLIETLSHALQISSLEAEAL